MTPSFARFASLVLAALPAIAAHADSSQSVLQSLGTNLTVIRASTSPQRLAIQPVPDVRSLHGVHREAVLSELGVPDNCAGGSRIECMSSPAWNYTFFHLPPGRHGGGPELMLLFDPRGAVRDAHWSYARAR